MDTMAEPRGPPATPAASAPAPRAPRITNACEACRAAKVKCQASTQLGICKRCLESKRECIFKTGPRTRRPRQPKRPLPTPTSTTTTPVPPPRLRSPPPGPSKTFTINIPMPADDDITDSLDALRLTHEHGLAMLVPDDLSDDDDYDEDAGSYSYDQDMADRDMDQVSSSSLVMVTPPGSGGSSVAASCQGQQQHLGCEKGGGSRKARTLASLRLQPQFNLDSAGGLLATFRGVMLRHFHCVVVGEGDTVESMARERPFVLLAVLAAASGSRTLQGHSLYDEEFRKILGLKFVAGGERTAELLQGLVVYLAWYPFHLRTKTRQATQYMRMVVDIVRDLELDEDPGTDSMEVPPTRERLDQIRLYLASYYLVSAFASTWARTPALTYTEHTARCSDLLQHHSPHHGDHVLAWQARLERLVEETNDLRRTQRGRSQSEYQVGLMIRGMETQLAEWEARIATTPAVASTPSVRIGVLSTRVFLSGAPLLKLPSAKTANPDGSAASGFRPDPQRLMAVIPALHQAYEYLLSLDAAELNSFISIEWGALILPVILGFRMSFPLAMCPEWDDGAARAALRFGEYLDRFCRMGGGVDAGEIKAGLSPAPGPGGGQRPSMDVLSASKIVLGMVRNKYVKRVAQLERQQQQQQQRQAAEGIIPPGHPAIPAASHDPTVSGCPMLDGSLEPYYPYWDETFASNPFVGETEGMPNDLWTAMTMDWAVQGGGGGGGFDGL